MECPTTSISHIDKKKRANAIRNIYKLARHIFEIPYKSMNVLTINCLVRSPFKYLICFISIENGIDSSKAHSFGFLFAVVDVSVEGNKLVALSWTVNNALIPFFSPFFGSQMVQHILELHDKCATSCLRCSLLFSSYSLPRIIDLFFFSLDFR